MWAKGPLSYGCIEEIGDYEDVEAFTIIKKAFRLALKILLQKRGTTCGQCCEHQRRHWKQLCHYCRMGT
jgi:hypothetical protein